MKYLLYEERLTMYVFIFKAISCNIKCYRENHGGKQNILMKRYLSNLNICLFTRRQLRGNVGEKRGYSRGRTPKKIYLNVNVLRY
jgi:hypothetical protein